MVEKAHSYRVCFFLYIVSMYNIEINNGVTVETLSANEVQYHFNTEVIILINISGDFMEIKDSNKTKYRKVEFSEITDKQGTADIQEYVEILIAGGYFRDNLNSYV